MDYSLESHVLGSWRRIIRGSLGFCKGYLCAMRDTAPRNALRLTRADGKVMDELEAREDVNIGMIAGWPTAAQYEHAAARALAKAKAIHVQNGEACEPDDLSMLAYRAYPGLKMTGACSAHREDRHFECQTCYPNWKALLRGHSEIQAKLYEELLELSGLSDPPDGRIGTNAIVAELKRKLGAGQ